MNLKTLILIHLGVLLKKCAIFLYTIILLSIMKWFGKSLMKTFQF